MGDYRENMLITFVNHLIPCKSKEYPAAMDFQSDLNKTTIKFDDKKLVKNDILPRVFKRNNLPSSYGRFRMLLFVRFNSRSVINSPENKNKY